MNRYAKMRQRQQEEFNNLPLGFAFSYEQFRKMMCGWGLDPEKDTDKLYRIPGGGFVQKKDHALFHETLDRHDAELQAAIDDDDTGEGFVYEMFLYELSNHEFGYTGDPEETLEALGFTTAQIMNTPKLKRGLEKAATRIAKESEWLQ